MVRLNKDDVKDNGEFITVFLRDGKPHTSRAFTITNEDCPFEPCTIIRKYMALRPPNQKITRFLIGFRSGKCIAQHVGVHTIGAVPKVVAKFLKLENPDSYTGHTLRRSSASMLVEGGADLITLNVTAVGDLQP